VIKKMAEEVLKFTKLTFIIHFIVALIFTVLFWIPDITIPLYVGVAALNLVTHAMSLTIGCLFAALTVSSLLGILAKEWKQVKIVVICEIVWLASNLVTSIISFSVFVPAMAALTLVITIIMLALFLLTFLQQEEIMKALF
jgi:hypothetical protein